MAEPFSGVKIEFWKDLTPESDLVRVHLLHLVIAHHGELEFGSPVEPKTPEAWALHMIDNLDAKLEIICRLQDSTAFDSPDPGQGQAATLATGLVPLPEIWRAEESTSGGENHEGGASRASS